MESPAAFNRLRSQLVATGQLPRSKLDSEASRPQQISPYGVVQPSDDEDDLPPRPPPKDPGYSPYSPYGAYNPQRSQTSLIPPKSSIPNTPASPSRWQTTFTNVASKFGTTTNNFVSPASSQVSLVLPVTPTVSQTAAGSSNPKPKFRLPRLKKRPSTATTASTTTEDDGSNQSHSAAGDEGISTPWGFQHKLHVDEALAGLPQEWAEALRLAGYTTEQVQALYAAKQARGLPPVPAQEPETPVAGPSTAATSSNVIVPRPRKDSLKRFKGSGKSRQDEAPVPLPPPIITSGPSHVAQLSIDNATISVATPIRRSPSTLRRLPNANSPWPSPPPSYDALTVSEHGSTTLSPSSTITQRPSPRSNTFPQEKHDIPLTEKPLPSPKASGSFRQALQNTLAHARSTPSLRKSSAKSDSSSGHDHPPIPSSSTSIPALPSLGRKPTASNARSTENSTFWDEDSGEEDSSEGQDQVSPLPPLSMKKSSKSLRTSIVPPRLELNLPSLDDLTEPTRSGTRPRNDSSSSSLLSVGTTSTNSKPLPLPLPAPSLSLNTGDSLDLGLGDWGTELLKAVIPTRSPDEEKPKVPSRASTEQTLYLRSNAKHSSQSTVASPNSISTTFSVTPSASSQSSHYTTPASQLPPAFRPVSLLPVVPLDLPPHKKPSQTTGYQPSLPEEAERPDSPTQPITPTAKDPVPQQKSTLPIPPALPSPVRSMKASNTPSPQETAPPLTPTTPTGRSGESSSPLDILISEEYTGPDDDLVLPYMRSPAAGQTTFDQKQDNSPQRLQQPPSTSIPRSTSTSTSGSSSMGTDATSYGNSSMTSTTFSDYGGSSATISQPLQSPQPLPSPTDSRPYSSMTLTPNAVKLSFATPPHSGAAANIPYDAVLDDWLEGEDEDGMESHESHGAINVTTQFPAPPTDIPQGPRSAGLSKPLPAITVQRPTTAESITQRRPSIPSPKAPAPAPPSDHCDPKALPPILASVASVVHSVGFGKFTHFLQVAEGQYGAVYSTKPKGSHDAVAIKTVAVSPENQPKFKAIRKEVELLQGVDHENVLIYDAVYLADLGTVQATFGMQETSPMLWLQMELMERSLADVLAFLSEGLVIKEDHLARFATDVLEGLDYLHRHNIAHRDVRSDTLLLSRSGTLKLADFSSATITSPTNSKRSSTQGQPPYWMAPEMRQGHEYDPHEADIWSIGATLWEVAEGDPPFIEVEDPRQFLDRLPVLSSENQYSGDFDQFLFMCTMPAGRRPRAVELLRTPFVQSACSHSEIIGLLAECRDIEDDMKTRQA